MGLSDSLKAKRTQGVWQVWHEIVKVWGPSFLLKGCWETRRWWFFSSFLLVNTSRLDTRGFLRGTGIVFLGGEDSRWTLVITIMLGFWSLGRMKKRKGSGMGYQSQPTHAPQYPWFLFIPFIRVKGFTAIHQENRTAWEKPWKSYCRVPLSRSKHCKCMFRCWGRQAMESQRV